MPHALVLTTPQVIAAIRDLEGFEFDARTMSDWSRNGLAPASVDPLNLRRRYSLADLHRLRLIARLKREGVTTPKIRNILAFCDRELPEVLRPRTRAVLVVDRVGRAVIVREPGKADVEVPGGQIRLPLREVVTDEKIAARYAAA